MYGRSNKLKTHQVLFWFILSQKDQFCFLLMLRNYAAEVYQQQKKIAQKRKLLSTKDSYKGDYGGKLKIFNIHTTLCPFWCILGGRVAQS